MIKLGDTVTKIVQFSQFSTGAAFATTGTPVGVIYKDGVVDDTTVTATIVNGASEVGLWKFSAVLSSGEGFAAGDFVDLRVTATVDAVAAAGIVLSDRIEAADMNDINTKTTNLPASPAAVGSAMTLAADAIKATSYDESTAYPLASADTGATKIARTGADSDTLETLSDEIAALENLSAADVNAEMVDVMEVDTMAEMTSGQPPATPTRTEQAMYLYQERIFESDETAALKRIKNSSGSTIADAVTSDDGTTTTRERYAAP